MNSENSLDVKTFSSLSKIYLLALGSIAFLVLISQIFIQRALSANDYDAQIINIAGKQRMLSQKISKCVLLLRTDLIINRDVEKELKNATKEWVNAHNLLRNNLINLPKTSEKKHLEELYNKVDVDIKELFNLSQTIQKSKNLQSDNYNNTLISFLKKEPAFLEKMNAYVYGYEKYASKKIKNIKTVESITFVLVLLLLLFEIIFLFKPAARKIRTTIKELIVAKDNAFEFADKANMAVKQKNETLTELQLLQKAINQTLFFARIDKTGTILSSGKRMQQIIDRQHNAHKHIIFENLGLTESDQQILKELITAEKGALLHHEFKVNLDANKIEWLDISVFPFIKSKGITEYLFVCLDITKRKKAQHKVEALNIEKMETERALQKSKASLIVEAQEEERKRIAKDIHDSIGQMLTALKFNLESLNVNQTDTLETRINELKQHTKNIILGVRMATFNLTPPELLDYGITTAIQKMVNQLNKFSDAKIVCENTIEENIRFNTLVETNLYRVTQECINNSIKYAEASFILVSIKKTDDLLSISVTDNGKGFDVKEITQKPKGGSEGGMGLFFMKERMEYINGRVFINSSPTGTRVVINFPILTFPLENLT